VGWPDFPRVVRHQVAVLHSALPDAERSREWWRVRRGEAKVVVGTRYRRLSLRLQISD